MSVMNKPVYSTVIYYHCESVGEGGREEFIFAIYLPVYINVVYHGCETLVNYSFFLMCLPVHIISFFYDCVNGGEGWEGMGERGGVHLFRICVDYCNRILGARESV